MIEPSSGSITIDGVNSADLERAKLRRGIGYVIQNAGLFPHRTVLQNIMTVPRLNGVPASRARSRALQ
ncbi:ATP-binding cassette domain-containing protein, partial [Leucobacter musarum]